MEKLLRRWKLKVRQQATRPNHLLTDLCIAISQNFDLAYLDTVGGENDNAIARFPFRSLNPHLTETRAGANNAGCGGQLITPMLLARRFILNPVLVIISLVFWFWMWGAPGAILSVPMLAITKIICDRIRPLAAFGHFLEG